MNPLANTDKKKILLQLEKQFGIKELPYLLLQFGNDKIRAYSGNLSKEELIKLDNTIRIENIGLYFAKWETRSKFKSLPNRKSDNDFRVYENHEIRLTLDGCQLLKKQITKNIVKLNKEQADEWMKGNDLNINTINGWMVLEFDNEFIGCGKSTGERISNFVPKERRIK